MDSKVFFRASALASIFHFVTLSIMSQTHQLTLCLCSRFRWCCKRGCKNFKGISFGGLEENFKFHLVDWGLICSPREVGSLGIRLLILMNQVLLGQWNWRFAVERDCLWIKILVWKYGCEGIEW